MMTRMNPWVKPFTDEGEKVQLSQAEQESANRPQITLQRNACGSLLWVLACLLLTVSCSVMPKQINETAMAPVPFETLVTEADRHRGQTVILGGYVVDVKNESTVTRMTAVQAPLGVGQEPKSKDLSRGRLILEYKGFLDPEVYSKDRKITVAGTVQGSSSTGDEPLGFPYVRIAVTEIHLWPVERAAPPPAYWDHYYWDPWYTPWGWRYPYWR